MMIPAEEYEGWGCLADITLTAIAFDRERSLEREREREREKKRGERVRNIHTRLINFGYNITMSLCTELEGVCACVRGWVCRLDGLIWLR